MQINIKLTDIGVSGIGDSIPISLMSCCTQALIGVVGLHYEYLMGSIKNT